MAQDVRVNETLTGHLGTIILVVQWHSHFQTVQGWTVKRNAKREAGSRTVCQQINLASQGRRAHGTGCASQRGSNGATRHNHPRCPVALTFPDRPRMDGQEECKT